jgi:hypothetical protein
VSTINHFDTIFSAHVQKILLDLTPWGDREQRTFKQKKKEDTRKDSAFREEQVGSKSLRATSSIQRPLPSTDWPRSPSPTTTLRKAQQFKGMRLI